MPTRNRCLALILARGGSKGIPGKNIKLLAGKPLITWTIQAALAADLVNDVVVSTDDSLIGDVAKAAGADVPFIRPIHLAGDDSSSIDGVVHALENIECRYEYVLLLQPTSPLRNSVDIDSMITFCLKRKVDSCVSLCKAKTHPQIMYQKNRSNRLESVLISNAANLRRQDFDEVYELNGAMYFARVDWFLDHRTFISENTVGYEMPIERSVDIDDSNDWALAEYLMGLKRE